MQNATTSLFDAHKYLPSYMLTNNAADDSGRYCVSGIRLVGDEVRQLFNTRRAAEDFYYSFIGTFLFIQLIDKSGAVLASAYPTHGLEDDELDG